jgi:uncharacterized membrane protein YdbT with pleckstrin-like domain
MAPDANQEQAGEAKEEILFEGYRAVVPGLGSLLLILITIGLALPFLWLRARACHYKLTSERVVVERGIFSKRLEQVDVYRITDYTVERPFSQRLLGTGNIQLAAMDRSTPSLRLEDLRTDVVALYERLRRATESQKRDRGVRVVDFDEELRL